MTVMANHYLRLRDIALPKKSPNCCRFLSSTSLQGWKTTFWAKPFSTKGISTGVFDIIEASSLQAFPTSLVQGIHLRQKPLAEVFS